MNIKLTDGQLQEIKDEIKLSMAEELNREYIIDYLKKLDNYDLINLLDDVFLSEKITKQLVYQEFKSFNSEEMIIAQIVLVLRNYR
jgi:Mg/Co/Ni transporter MgtE